LSSEFIFPIFRPLGKNDFCLADDIIESTIFYRKLLLRNMPDLENIAALFSLDAADLENIFKVSAEKNRAVEFSSHISVIHERYAFITRTVLDEFIALDVNAAFENFLLFAAKRKAKCVVG